MPEGNSRYTGQALGLRLLKVDRVVAVAQHWGEVLVEGACEDLGRCEALGMQLEDARKVGKVLFWVGN